MERGWPMARAVALLAAGSIMVHELRYVVAYGRHADQAEPPRYVDRREGSSGPNAAAVFAVAPKLFIGGNEIAVLFAAMMQVLVN